MKYVLSAILVIMVTVGISYAQPEEKPVNKSSTERIEKTTKQERHRRMRSKSYSRRLNSIVAKSTVMVSDQKQKAELMEIRDRVVASLAKKEKEYRLANAQIQKSLSNADFDAATVKKEFTKTQELQTAIFDEYLEGLSEIKKIIGDDNFNNLFTMTKGKYKKPKADGEKKKDADASKAEPEKNPAEENTEAN